MFQGATTRGALRRSCPSSSPRVLITFDILAAHANASTSYCEEQGKTELIHGILKLGVSVDDVGHRGEIALFLTAKHGHPDRVKLLLKRGASRWIRNDNLATLDIARRKGQEVVIQLLLTPHRIVDGHLVPRFHREPE